MKNIIQRNLDLSQKYFLIDKKYIPLENSVGLCCSNCNKLIANIATVRDSKGAVFNIGFDCLETLLINNQLLSGKDILEYERVKKLIPKIIRFAKLVKEVYQNNHNITGLLFERQTYNSDYYTFYWLTRGSTSSRDNDNVKITDNDFDFMIETLKNIFTKMDILIKD